MPDFGKNSLSEEILSEKGEASVLIAGFGGQGILFEGQVLADSLMLKGFNVTFFPSYGAEMRGGTANATVVYSPEEVASPIVDNPDFLIAMNQPSFVKFSPKASRVVLVNSSLVSQKVLSDVDTVAQIFSFPFSNLAEETGSLRVANMVSLGALWAVLGYDVEDLLRGLEDYSKHSGKEKFLPLNVEAVKKGFSLVK